MSAGSIEAPVRETGKCCLHVHVVQKMTGRCHEGECGEASTHLVLASSHTGICWVEVCSTCAHQYRAARDGSRPAGPSN